MKVLQINAVSKIHSTGRTTYELNEFLNSHGHLGYIAYSDGPPVENGYKVGTSIDKKTHAFLSRLSGKQAYFSKNATHKLIDFIRSISPDIIHLRNLHGNYINLPILLKFLVASDIPTVITLHDCWFYTGKCTHYTVDGCFRWKENCGKCPRLHKDNPSWFLDRTTKMLIDKRTLISKVPRLAVVGVSDWITTEAQYSILSSAKIIQRVYNWIDFGKFGPREMNLIRKRRLNLENKFILLGVASAWGEKKGLTRFIELRDKLDDNYAIILLGGIKKPYVIPSNIIHIPLTHDIDELCEFYTIADIFINFSIEESFGKVVAEALACGTPIITSNATANPELVNEECGIVLRQEEDIVDAIKKIERNGKHFYSKSCIKFAKDNFSSINRMNDYISIYEKLMKM